MFPETRESEGFIASHQGHHHHHHEIHFTVDGEPCETRKHELTPNEIIAEFGHLDIKTHYLVRIEAHHEHKSYEGKGSEPIAMSDRMRFQIVSTGPTPVS